MSYVVCDLMYFYVVLQDGILSFNTKLITQVFKGCSVILSRIALSIALNTSYYTILPVILPNTDFLGH